MCFGFTIFTEPVFSSHKRKRASSALTKVCVMTNLVGDGECMKCFQMDHRGEFILI